MKDDTQKPNPERFREMGEYLSQLAALAAGSIVVMATFSSSRNGSQGAWFAVGAIALLAYSILAAMLARVMLLFLAPMRRSDPDVQWVENVAAWSLATGVIAFGLGIIALAIYAGFAV